MARTELPRWSWCPLAAQHDALRGRKLPMAALIVGGLSEYQQLEALRRASRVVVATPGRLGDFLDRQLMIELLPQPKLQSCPCPVH